VLQRGRTGGTAVNIAARLEQIAEPGGICLSSSVFEQVRRIVTASYEFLGDQRLKNIREAVAVYGIRAEDRIALRVATAIAPHLRERELSRALRKHPAGMTAYDLTLQALDLFPRLDHASITQARELLEQAVAHDPDYAPAYSNMASLHMRWIGQGWSEDEMADRRNAANAARLAIERDRNDAIGLAIYGHVQSYLLKDYTTAGDYFK
jgi:hypothetical protein